MTAGDEAFQKWTKWIGTIHMDVTNLVIGCDVFREVQEIIKSNPRIQKPGSFYGWLGTTYTAWGSMAVRRQLDNDSISLKKLLGEVAVKPEVLSRERYVTAYAAMLMRGSEGNASATSATRQTDGGAYTLSQAKAEEIAHRSFDKLVGRGNPHVPNNLIDSDISELREVGEKIKVFADKKIAHLVESQPKSLPTFDDLDDCVKVLERLVIKYELILKRSAPQSLLPTWQYDWKAIFYEPWIQGP